MTPLHALLLRRIRTAGPITLAEYMADCLLHPTYGYYATRDPFGVGGDFTTAPEISQMFGELLGLSLAQTWIDQGSPPRISLAELGPGRGTLMADVLRATRGVPGFPAAAEVHLIEASATLRGVQAATLGGYAPIWHDHPDALPDQPLYLIAKEFSDALPIRQFQRDPQGWRERLVGISGDSLIFGLSDPAPVPALAHRLPDTTPGDIVELCPAAAPITASIAQTVAHHGGAAIIIDYGGWRSRGDTFQAVQSHAPTDPLQSPGEADLTAHVDFEALAMAAQQAAPQTAHSQLIPQGVLLERLGITARAEALAKRLTGNPLASQIAAHRRLTHPAEMGNLFQALALYPVGQTPPPGFEP